MLEARKSGEARAFAGHVNDLPSVNAKTGLTQRGFKLGGGIEGLRTRKFMAARLQREMAPSGRKFFTLPDAQTIVAISPDMRLRVRSIHIAFQTWPAGSQTNASCPKRSRLHGQPNPLVLAATNDMLD